MTEWGTKKPNVDRGLRKGTWETDCGENHGEAGDREKDDLNLCMKFEIHS